MSTQPEALRLARLIADNWSRDLGHEAAAELRRLHALNQELLEALKAYDAWADKTICTDPVLRQIRKQMRAARAKAEAA